MNKINKQSIKLETLGFAKMAHGDQKRKYTGEPYWVHPLEVSLLLEAVIPNCPIEVILAGILHDVVEDTKYTNKDIKELFGDKVAELVYWVTDISKKEDGNRDKRKAIDREHISKAPAEAQSIKLADLINNTESIEKHDPDFAKVYMREKSLLLEVLTKGDKILYDIAKQQVDKYFMENPKERLYEKEKD